GNRDLSANDRRERIKLLRPLALSPGIIILPFYSEIISKPLMRRRVIRVEADGSLVFCLGFRPAPQLVIRERRGRVRLGERVVKLEGAIRGGSGFRQGIT